MGQSERVWQSHIDDGDTAMKAKRYSAARKAYALAVAEAETFEPVDFRLPESLDNLASVYFALNEMPRSEECHRRALILREAILGPDHLELAEGLGKLGHLHQIQQDFLKAERAYMRALSIREAALGAEHPKVAECLMSLAYFNYHYKGEDGKANPEPLYRRALAITEKSCGALHADTINILRNLACYLRSEKRYTDYEKIQHQVVARQIQSLGRHDPAIADSYLELIDFYSEQGKYADPLYQKVLALANGPAPVDNAQVLHKLADHYRFQRDDERKALALYKQSLSIQEKALGQEHPHLVQTINSLASMLSAAENYSEAAAMYERMVSIEELKLGENHLDISELLSKLADIYACQGKFQKGADIYRRVIDIQERTLGATHVKLTTSLVIWAQAKMSLHDHKEAEAAFLRVEEIAVKAMRQGAFDFRLPTALYMAYEGLISIHSELYELYAELGPEQSDSQSNMDEADNYRIKMALLHDGSPASLRNLAAFYGID